MQRSETPWNLSKILASEKNALGFYISGHPLASYRESLKDLAMPNLSACKPLAHRAEVTVAGVVTALQIKLTKKGDKFALMQLEDETCQMKCVVWSASFSKYEAYLVQDAPLLGERQT
jgi:DNA polymerase-3 subunit alpha